jgi:hypothetical protein
MAEDLGGGKRRNLGNGLKAALLILLLIGLGILVWVFLRKNVAHTNNSTSSKAPSPQGNFQNSSTPIDSLISYKLPAGWTDTDCISGRESILIISSTQPRPNCAIDLQRWSIRIAMATQNITSCNQIKVNNQQVTNHVCASQTINGKSTLKSSTTYNEKSPYGHAVKVSDYFIKTAKGTVKLEYVDDLTTNNDDFQVQFDQIANSVKVK